MAQPLDLSRRTLVVDVVAIFSVAVLLPLIHVGTTPTQKAILSAEAGTGLSLSLFTAAYVHYGSTHVVTNVVGYLSAAVMSYLLCLQIDRRRWFHLTAVALLCVLPWVVNWASGLVFTEWGRPVEITGRGFSGIVAGYGGFVYVAAVVYVRDRHGGIVAVGIAGLVLSVVTLQGYLSWIGSPSPMLVGTLIVAFVTNLAGLVALTRPQTYAFSTVVHAVAPICFAGVLLMTFVAGLFPTDISSGDRFLNIYAHGIGAVGGVVLAAVLFVISVSTGEQRP